MPRRRSASTPGRIAAAMTTAMNRSASTSLSFQSASTETRTAAATIVAMTAGRAVELDRPSPRSWSLAGPSGPPEPGPLSLTPPRGSRFTSVFPHFYNGAISLQRRVDLKQLARIRPRVASGAAVKGHPTSSSNGAAACRSSLGAGLLAPDGWRQTQANSRHFRRSGPTWSDVGSPSSSHRRALEGVPEHRAAWYRIRESGLPCNSAGAAAPAALEITVARVLTLPTIRRGGSGCLQSLERDTGLSRSEERRVGKECR